MEETIPLKRGKTHFTLQCSCQFIDLFYVFVHHPKNCQVEIGEDSKGFSFWGGGALENKMHLVKWSSVCKAKLKGGLGVHSLFLLSKALLCKNCQCFSSERDLLWKTIIKESLGRKKRVGGQECSESPMGLGFGKRLGSIKSFLIRIFPSKWVMGIE